MMACKRFVFSLCVLGALTLPVAQADAAPSATSEQVTITDVKVRMSDHGPIVLLQAEGKSHSDLCRRHCRRIHPRRIEW